MPPPDARYTLISEGRPSGFNILGAVAHHPRLAKAFFTLQAHLLLTTSLNERQRELVIMRTAALRRSTYEWAQHLFMARDAGLSDIEISWIVWGPDAPTWSPGDASVLRAVDDLLLDGVIKDSNWAALAEHLDPQQILDVIFTAGSYAMLASMLDSLGIELDEDLQSGVNDLTRPPAEMVD
ncbi:carboxymuconolactone decarboxylase family protein [Mycolicibacterium xanthum]|uniref:carboxymuconolactone decarboxylase family protein n=1 Tax=Mycolicibacterium xanthum TaxID=2796469 RepID=UPI0021050CCA|nr:carboxymuconolactone decarboxylase family protein [Mycolicibacterium xanthum]